MAAGQDRPVPVIRAIEPEDAAEVARLQAMPGYRAGTLRPPYPTASAARRFLEGARADDLLLGAFLDGRLVGNGGLHRFDGRRRHAAMLGMGVADDLTGRGLGTALLLALLDSADCWLDIHRIELTVHVQNEPAVRLYERHGFEREGVLRDWAFRDGRYVDAIAMARLRPPARSRDSA
jgi:L-phenylalanine/L-methionine N-acetyltransferase